MSALNSIITFYASMNFSDFGEVKEPAITLHDSYFKKIERNNKREEKEAEKRALRDIEFEHFWKMYNKPIGRKICYGKFHRLSDDDVQAIAVHLPKYIEATPDKLFRKNPQTYLNQRSWEDVIITKRNSKDNGRLTREERIERLRNSI